MRYSCIHTAYGFAQRNTPDYRGAIPLRLRMITELNCCLLVPKLIAVISAGQTTFYHVQHPEGKKIVAFNQRLFKLGTLLLTA